MLHTSASDSPSDVRITGQCLGIFNFIENDKFGKFFSSKLNLSRQTFHAQGFGAQAFENDRQRYEWMLNLLNLICSLIGIFYGFFVTPLHCIPSALITRAGPQEAQAGQFLLFFGAHFSAREVMRQTKPCQ